MVGQQVDQAAQVDLERVARLGCGHWSGSYFLFVLVLHSCHASAKTFSGLPA
jgi:hypothetical protein